VSVQVLCIACSEMSFYDYMGNGMCLFIVFEILCLLHLFAYKRFHRDKKKELRH